MLRGWESPPEADAPRAQNLQSIYCKCDPSIFFPARISKSFLVLSPHSAWSIPPHRSAATAFSRLYIGIYPHCAHLIFYPRYQYCRHILTGNEYCIIRKRKTYYNILPAGNKLRTPGVGFEPTTKGLTVPCATAAPPRNSEFISYNQLRFSAGGGCALGAEPTTKGFPPDADQPLAEKVPCPTAAPPRSVDVID